MTPPGIPECQIIESIEQITSAIYLNIKSAIKVESILIGLKDEWLSLILKYCLEITFLWTKNDARNSVNYKSWLL